ncbi:MAG TPA: hypothetical protein VHQ41_00685 [Patescibacteria group bacterium]|jgi:hypothetical protein|nr:hypothetical protein [Patescibacteria group bacterium]
MKKILFASAAIMLLAVGCNPTPNLFPPATDNAPTSNTNTTPPSSEQTYSNATYGLQFKYPATLQFVESNYALLDNKITSLGVSKADYANTNLGDASIDFSAVTATSLNACLAANPPENGDGFKTKKTINGTTFYMTKAGGAGAGNFYASNVYRAFGKNNLCLEVNETIHTGNIGNYPAGTVTEVNSAAITSIFDKVLNTITLK